jgi:hypothetical protein
LINYLCGGRENHTKPSTKYFKEVGIMADNKELLFTLAQALGIDLTGAQDKEEVKAPSEPRYIIFVGKSPRKVKAPYIAINASGELSAFTEESDVLGKGTDKVGKFTMDEIKERFPQFNHEAFLIQVED